MEPTPEDAIIRERKERKKLQNRLNQRARRSRLKEEKTDGKTGHRPYEVDRWRVHYSNGEASDKQLAIRAAKPGSGANNVSVAGGDTMKPVDIARPLMDTIDQVMCLCSAKSAMIKAFSSRLSADQLLDLIQFNVFRALVTNKHSLTAKAEYYHQNTEGPLIPYLETEYPGNAVILPRGDLPVSLSPTNLQITVRHATWIDLLPFPRMRDNLISAHSQFDHAELANDIIGNLIDLSRFFRPESHRRGGEESQASSGRAPMSGPPPREDGALAPPRGGFIVYGPPHKVESWEVTPEFVWKWGWTLMGCSELIESTNRWRQSRGEAPLPMIITRPWHSNSLGGLGGLGT